MIGGIGMGMLVAPRRTIRAWKEAPGDASLFHEPLDYETCLDMNLGDLRERMGIPRDGLYLGTRGFHAAAPSR